MPEDLRSLTIWEWAERAGVRGKVTLAARTALALAGGLLIARTRNSTGRCSTEL